MSSVTLKWTWAYGPILLFIASFGSSAILEPSLEMAIPFYKAPNSPFPSGQTRKSTLVQSQQGGFTDFHYSAMWGQKRIEVKNEHILRELDVAYRARARKKTSLQLMAELNSSVVLELQHGQIVEIESMRGVWARVRASSLHKGYVLLTDLENTEDDNGVLLGLTDVILKKAPDAKAGKVVTIPALTRMQLISYSGEYAFVKTNSKSGYVALRDVVGRSDFAQWAWHPARKRWHAVRHRNGSQIVLAGDEKLHINQFSAFKGLKNRALISGDHPVAGRGARVELIEPTAVKWTQSIVKDHGAVWWKTDLLEKAHDDTTITTAELMKKQLKGISFDPKTKKGLASAGGVYRTLDGKNWTKVAFFGQDNWPVSLHSSGVWFVGHYRSTDEGLTFKPTIKWSDLVETLQTGRNKALTHFRVLDVENMSKTHVALKVDTGITIVKIKAPVLGNHWTLLK